MQTVEILRIDVEFRERYPLHVLGMTAQPTLALLIQRGLFYRGYL